MADTVRQEKLASAKKKLKQFQQRRAPKLPRKEGTVSPIPKKDGPLLSPPVIEFTGQDKNSAQGVLFPSPKQNGSRYNEGSRTVEESVVSDVKPMATETGNIPAHKMEHSVPETMIVNTHDIHEDSSHKDSEISAAEKIKQHSKQLNGLIQQDVFTNGGEAIAREIQTLQSRNTELVQGLQSCKRSNQQLSKQVNDQRKQVLQLQEQLRKERAENAGKQQQEQGAMKEQLQVHIQTIGILVSEKSELQASVSSLQRKLQSKTSESDDINNRLQVTRQRVVELERNIANLQMTCEKHDMTYKQVIEEKEKLAMDLQNTIKEKDEFHQQNSELSEKLQIKVDECGLLKLKVDEMAASLQKAELVAHQLSPDKEKSEVFDQLHREKEELQRTLDAEVNRSRKLSGEYQQIRERYREHTDQLEKHIENLLQQISHRDLNDSNLLSENEELLSTISKQQAEIEELRKKLLDGMDISTETEQFSLEKERLEQELDIQIKENRRLGREVLEKEDQIHELNTSLRRAEDEHVDRGALLESIQSDKETISRAMQQNKQLKDQLEELEDGFVKMSNANAEATNNLQNEQHVNKELASKLSGMVVELEELKQELTKKEKVLVEIENSTNELRTEYEATRSAKDAELTKLRDEVAQLHVRLEEQVHVNDRLAHMEARAELTDRLQIELQSAQDNINHITIQNNSLRSTLQQEQEKNSLLQEELVSLREEASKMTHIEDHPEKSKHFIQSPTPNSLEGATDYSTETETDSAMDPRKVIEGMETEEDESDVGDRDSTLHFSTFQEEKVQSLNLTIENLTNEREELVAALEKERQSTGVELGNLREHMHLQLQQELQLQSRQLHEHFHQQLHEQQLKLNSLQDTIDTYKRQGDLMDRDLNENDISFDAVKTAFRQLQARFKTLMEEKATLADKIQEIEHKNLQLSVETETIGEYISLYHTQRQALKTKFLEKDRIISQLSNEHGRMQVKINQLQQLVSRILEERSGMELEKRQLQELVNKRLALQSGSDRSTEIPKLNYSLDSIFGDNSTHDNTDNYESETESTIKSFSDATLEIKADEEPSHFDTPVKVSTDGTALQIRQLFEQLHNTKEGFQHGWMSPGMRKHLITPCPHCSSKLIQL